MVSSIAYGRGQGYNRLNQEGPGVGASFARSETDSNQLKNGVVGETDPRDASRFAFLSDIHGNSPALRAVLDDIQHEGCTRVFMLGDIVIGVDPHGCIQLLRSWSDRNGVDLVCIKGNAEAYLVTPDRDAPIKHPDIYVAELLKVLQWCQDHLSASDLDWIHSLPDVVRWNGTYLVHDSPMDRTAVQTMTDVLPQYRELNFHGRGITPDMAASEWDGLSQFMRAEGIARVFSGHTHCPFYRAFGDLLVCNVGSAGMPLDGDPRPSWVKLTTNNSGSQSVSIRRVAYDTPSMLQLIDRTADYPGFSKAGVQEAWKQMYQRGRYWGELMAEGHR